MLLPVVFLLVPKEQKKQVLLCLQIQVSPSQLVSQGHATLCDDALSSASLLISLTDLCLSLTPTPSRASSSHASHVQAGVSQLSHKHNVPGYILLMSKFPSTLL